MRKKVVLTLVSFCLIFATSFSPAKAQMNQDSEVIRVVVTILPLADFVENVGGNKVKVTVMVPPGANPHTYEPTPDQLRELTRAKIYVKVGSGMDFELTWMSKFIEINRNMLICDSSRGIQLIRKDPHIWLSPLNAKIQVENIYEALVKVDPVNRKYYSCNKENYIRKLNELDTGIRKELLKIKKREFMVFHPAWGYFAREYNLKQIAVEKEGKEPAARDLVKLIKQARKIGIKTIFVSPQFSTKGAKVIAREIGGKLVFIDPLARDYIENMHRVLSELIQALK